MLPENLILHTRQGERSVVKVGPSMWGYIYREKEGGYFYRIIPIEDVQQVDKRDEIAELSNAPRKPQIAPIIEAEVEPQYIDNKIYFYIQYEMAQASTWNDILLHEKLDYQLLCLSRIINAIPKWFRDTRKNLIPLPSDIVFTDHTPFLLKLPSIDRPRVESLFSEPHRIPYLAPELLCGRSMDISEETITYYAIGIQALQCLYQWQLKEPAENLLIKSVNNTLLLDDPMTLRIPDWAREIPEIDTMIREIHPLVSPDLRIRSAVKPDVLSKTIEQNLRYLVPEYAVAAYIKRKEFQLAHQVLKKILLDHPSYALYLMAADLAGTTLQLIPEALNYYEEAIKLDNDALEAYKRQNDLVMSHLESLFSKSSGEKGKGSPELSTIDKILKRNFYQLPFEMREDIVEKTAEYFNRRCQFDTTEKLLSNHFHDRDKNLLWWKFQRWYLLIQAYIGKSDYERAKQTIQSLKKNLALARGKPQFDQAKVSKFGQIVTELELALHEIKRSDNP